MHPDGLDLEALVLNSCGSDLWTQKDENNMKEVAIIVFLVQLSFFAEGKC